MNRRLAILFIAAVCATAWQSAEACRFCQSGPDVGRYGNQDPMNSVQFDALVDQYRDMGAPLPTPEEVVTSKAALAQAAAVAVPQPGSAVAPNTPNSFRARLLQSNPGVAATVPAGAVESDGAKVKPLGKWTSHVVDASILGALLGVVMFFRRGTRRQTA